MSMMRTRRKERGFSLIELIVSVALFATVMLVSVATLLALVDANRKAQALQSVMNNLNVALDSMVRSIRMGSTYHCGSAPYTSALSCPSGSTVFAFEPFGGDPDDATDQWVYEYDSVTKRLYKSEHGGLSRLPVTAPEVQIEEMVFYVIGTDRGCTVSPCDAIQPKVVISIRGTAGTDKAKTTTDFAIQATAVQRLLDL